jgi:uncharacterized protein YlzI (FlbEa/FlbD family)
MRRKNGWRKERGMSKYIKVKGLNGKGYVINAERIMCIESHSERGYIDASVIVFNENSFIKVSESPDMILKLIERSENGKS